MPQRDLKQEVPTAEPSRQSPTQMQHHEKNRHRGMQCFKTNQYFQQPYANPDQRALIGAV